MKGSCPMDLGGRIIGVAVLTSMSLLFASPLAWAGPPYVTDDPEPVDYRHWEFYLASQHELTGDGAVGTGPHLEVNYGAVPNLQLHALVPITYARPAGGPTDFGPGDIELGAKYRFIQEGAYRPMVGTFPMLEVPVGDPSKGLGTGHWHGFLPVWLQKTVGRWSGYGGGGYWLNPGSGNLNYWFIGGQVQRRIADAVAVGAEIFYTTADRAGATGNLRGNAGAVVDFTPNHHLLVSAGRSIKGDTRFFGYLAYQLTL